MPTAPKRRRDTCGLAWQTILPVARAAASTIPMFTHQTRPLLTSESRVYSSIALALFSAIHYDVETAKLTAENANEAAPMSLLLPMVMSILHNFFLGGAP
jgi:hypothetical protein